LLAAIRDIGGVTLVVGGLSALPALAKLHPKIIISYAINFYLWEIALKMLSGAKLVTERRNLYHWVRSERRRRVQEIVRNLLTTRIICNSGAVMRSVLDAEWFARGRISVIPNALDVEPSAELVDGGRVVAVSNIKAGKGVAETLEVFGATLHTRGASGVSFELFGRLDEPGILSGVDGRWVAAFYKGEGRRETIFLGAVCIVHLSEAEGFPNAVLEAMAHGAVPVLSDIGVHRELFSGAAVFVRDSGTAAQALKQLLSERVDRPDVFAERRRVAKKTALGFSISRRVGAYAEIIADCLR
jgi:glycosyltransferase involved in cell wall biosynthesis